MDAAENDLGHIGLVGDDALKIAVAAIAALALMLLTEVAQDILAQAILGVGVIDHALQLLVFIGLARFIFRALLDQKLAGIEIAR